MCTHKAVAVYISIIQIVKKWNNPNPPTDECTGTIWHIHNMKYYLAIRRNEILAHTTAAMMNLESIMLSEEVGNKRPLLYDSPY